MDKFCKDCKHSFLENQNVIGLMKTRPISTPIYLKILKCGKKFTTKKDNFNGVYKVYEGIEAENLNKDFDCKDFEPIEPKRSWWSRLFKGGK